MSVPGIFISHGGPNILLEKSAARDYLQSLEKQVGRPDAIVIMSAHFETDGAVVVRDPSPGMIYDFGGFQDELYRRVYPAPGEPILAERVADMLGKAGIPVQLDDKRGYDHGTWTAMMLAFPQADIPIVQISIDPSQDAVYHYQMGRALEPLRHENILLVGSGHITHNLRAVFSAMRGNIAPDAQMAEKVEAFTDWFADKFLQNDKAAILDWKNQAPFVEENHPSDEHLMPLFFAYGAAGDKARPKRAHHSTQMGFFAFDSWIFE
jgi:4,5-DOPA dioxygenase extradiol